MKRIILFVLLFAAIKVAGQTTGYLRFDTVKIMKQNGTCELYIINKTKDSLGLLTNIGGGLTSFKKSRALNDSQVVVGNDTLTIRGTGGSGSGVDSLRQNIDSIKLFTGGTGTFQFKNKNTDTTAWYNAKDYGMVGNGSFDNTTALQTLINSLAAKKRNAIIYFPDTVYKFSGALQDTSRINAVIVFPSVDIDSVQYTITLRGKRHHTYSPSAFISSVPFPEGTVLRYTLNTKQGTEPAFLGGKGPIGGDYAETSYMMPALEDLTIQMPDTSKLTAVNFRHFTNTYTKNINIVAGTSQSVLDKPEPTDSTVYGYIQPDFSHGVNQICDGELNISGFYNGIRVGEGSLINNLNLYSNKVGVVVDGADGSMYIKRMIVGWHPVAIKARTGYTKSTLLIDSYNNERWVAGTSGASEWYDFVSDIDDPSNQLSCEVRSKTVIAGVGTDPTTACFFTMTGGTGVYQRCQGSAPPPAIPAIISVNSNTSYNALDITNTSTGTSAIAGSVYRNNASNVFSFGVTGTNYSSSLIQGDQGFFYSSAANGIRFLANHASGGLTFLTGASSTPSLTITAAGNSTIAGNLGVGVAPSTFAIQMARDGLNLAGNGYVNFSVKKADEASGVYLGYNSGISGSGIIAASAGPLAFWSYNGVAWGERMRLVDNGNFLVGTTTDNGALGQFNGDVTVADEAYDATAWNGSLEVPTKNAVRDKIESLSFTGVTSINSQTGASQTISGNQGLSVSSSSDVHTISLNTTLESFLSDVNNTGTSETDLYSHTLSANRLTLNGHTARFVVTGTTNDATATHQIQGYFAGNVIYNSGGEAISGTGGWRIEMEVTRTSSTTARASVRFEMDNATITGPVQYTALSSLDFTSTNIFKVTGTAGGGGGGSNDITATVGKVTFIP